MSSVSPLTVDANAGCTHPESSDLSGVFARRFADYRQMVRPRIIVMSAAAVMAGFVLASPIAIEWAVLAISVVGICCLVAASSVLNQVIESSTDFQMNRTADRPVASGRLTRLEATLFGCGLSILGTYLLARYVNSLTSIAALSTMLTYVLLYTPLKPISALCTTVGAIPGAMPPVLGWFAAGGAMGAEALTLFAVFFVWQFPHFLAIGWIYRDDYETAGLKMLPSFHDGGRRAGWIALVYAISFVPISCLPRFVGLAGSGYLAAALVLSVGYLWLTVRFFVLRTNIRARQLMIGSLICLPALLVCLVSDYLRLLS
jgi:protoheme IX farnesyltransferase